MTPVRVIERYLASLRPEGGCLVSSYSTGSHGYTQIGWQEGAGRFMVLGHRVAWEARFGPIPPDMTVDHRCRNRRCGNTYHLRLLSNLDNATDNGQRRRTHCPKGHEYTTENTYRDRHGHRRCRRCRHCARENRR